MKPFLSIFLLAALYGTSLSQPIPDYYTRNRFLLASPAAFEGGLVGSTNPANLIFLHQPEFRFFWSTDGKDQLSLKNWGLFSGMRHLGFSVQRQKFDGVGVTDFRLSTGFGSPELSYGLAYGWSKGKSDASGRESLISAGTILRPSRYFSFGLVGNFSLESSSREGIAEIGIRPFGTPRLTLFADAALQKGTKIKNAPWSAGAVLQLAPGFHLVGRYFESDAFTLGLSINFGKSGMGTQSHFDPEANYASNTYFLRRGGMKRSFSQTHFSKNKRYTTLALKGRVDYLKYKFLDSTQRFMDILGDIQAAIADPRVSALALNLSGMRVRPEHAWEIREALKNVQSSGKKVVIFIDRAQMTSYHLASVADKIVLDPQGSIMLRGYALGRTYFKGTLEKLGLGFDEWRFFKYKSANETFSRDSMSVADREQLQDYLDDWYELTRSEVCAARNLSTEEFDRLIDDESYFAPEQALEAGLVDTLARWSGVDGIINQMTSESKKGLAAAELLANALPPENWGTLPKVAVVYGLGVCAMDEGIRARWLERVFLALGKSKSVKAVVFRVDSPGGDGMASDLVAEALKKCSETKPVIISQGQVAASGGYWISMYGDKILAGPNTITGSIGVIFGWVYDKGIGAKLGMTSDLVQRGKHADLGRGISIPFTGLRVPARNLTPEERQKAETIIRQHYQDFVERVAAGRSMTVERVKEIAQGRIYSGIDGKEMKLVDEIGGLMQAIEIAREEAGLKQSQEVEIIEIPNSKGFLDLKKQISPINFQVLDDPVLQFIKMVSERLGEPLPILIPGTYPDLP